MRRLLAITFLSFFVQAELGATHIRAGEIITRRISLTNPTFEIKVIGYTDTGSPVEFGGGIIEFGDGTQKSLMEADSMVTINLGDEVAYNEFIFVYTYPAAGDYVIRYTERNRNEGVLNMTNSINTPFYIETKISIDLIYGLNRSPVLLVPPIDHGAVGVPFIHNPGAFDPDGDSIAFSLRVPRQSREAEVFAYKAPNDPVFYQGGQSCSPDVNQQPVFSLDSLTGDLLWDAPGMMGEYNVAFVIEEYRKIEGQWKQLGYVTRDMQIIIEECNNEPPEVMVPEDICVEAGTLIAEQILGIDPEGLPVKLEAFGGPFELGSPAEFSPFPAVYQNAPGTLDFSWQTNCSHVRERPYEVQFKVTDTNPDGPDPRLADIKTWNITVVAPAPTGVAATVQPGKVIDLGWDAYSCAAAESLQIWRRIDSYDFAPENCEVGMPAYAGYELMDVVDGEAQSYSDDNLGNGLAPGANYCYRLVATFPQPGGGVSYASAEVCTIILADAPVITNVDVEQTGETDGEILVKWQSPFEIDKPNFPTPYTYEIFRAEGFRGEENIISLGATQDTLFSDSGLNTRDVVYNYRVHLLEEDGSLIDTSAVASAVRLDLKPLLQSIELRWDAAVPWSVNTREYPVHYVYRNRVGENQDNFSLIGEANVNSGGLYFLDDGSFNGVPLNENLEYCYYITTQGSYGNPAIAVPLLNRSQLACAQPNDRTPPCAPVNLVIDDAFNCESHLANLTANSCNFNTFSNGFSWEGFVEEGCEDDVRSFNIYFSESGEEGTFNLIDNVPDEAYLHSGLNSFKGCYKVAAVDRSGNESELTEAICNDNCPYFELPNVFTPNGDGRNDVFRPFYTDGSIAGFDPAKCMRFVKEVTFRVFDRSGNTIYSMNSNGIESSILIDWNGRAGNGAALPAGVYYYTADVVFDVLDPKQANRQFKGWVNLMR